MRDPESPLPASSPGAGAGKEGLGTGFHGRPARLTRNLYISHWPEGLGHWMAFHLQVREAPGLLAFASPMAARPPQEKGFLFTLQELVRGVAPAHNTADATKQISHCPHAERETEAQGSQQVSRLVETSTHSLILRHETKSQSG